jgi:hypothetical protein
MVHVPSLQLLRPAAEHPDAEETLTPSSASARSILTEEIEIYEYKYQGVEESGGCSRYHPRHAWLRSRRQQEIRDIIRR